MKRNRTCLALGLTRLSFLWKARYYLILFNLSILKNKTGLTGISNLHYDLRRVYDTRSVNTRSAAENWGGH